MTANLLHDISQLRNEVVYVSGKLLSKEEIRPDLQMLINNAVDYEDGPDSHQMVTKETVVA